jgi:hypothetical protein
MTTWTTSAVAEIVQITFLEAFVRASSQAVQAQS